MRREKDDARLLPALVVDKVMWADRTEEGI